MKNQTKPKPKIKVIKKKDVQPRVRVVVEHESERFAVVRLAKRMRFKQWHADFEKATTEAQRLCAETGQLYFVIEKIAAVGVG